MVHEPSFYHQSQGHARCSISMVTFYPKIALATNCQHESFKNDVDHFQESTNNKQTYHYNIVSPSRRSQRGEVILVQVIILGCKDLLASNCCALVLHATRIPYCQFYSNNRPFNILLENVLLLTCDNNYRLLNGILPLGQSITPTISAIPNKKKKIYIKIIRI